MGSLIRNLHRFCEWGRREEQNLHITHTRLRHSRRRGVFISQSHGGRETIVSAAPIPTQHAGAGQTLNERNKRLFKKFNVFEQRAYLPFFPARESSKIFFSRMFCLGKLSLLFLRRGNRKGKRMWVRADLWRILSPEQHTGNEWMCTSTYIESFFCVWKGSSISRPWIDKKDTRIVGSPPSLCCWDSKQMH